MILLIAIVLLWILIPLGIKILFSIDSIMMVIIGFLIYVSFQYSNPDIFSSENSTIIGLVAGLLLALIYNGIVKFLYKKSNIFLYVWNYLMAVGGIVSLYYFIKSFFPSKKGDSFFFVILKNPIANTILVWILILIGAIFICRVRIATIVEDMDLDDKYYNTFRKNKIYNKKTKKENQNTDNKQYYEKENTNNNNYQYRNHNEEEKQNYSFENEFMKKYEHYCNVLNITNYLDVTQEEVKENYRKLAKKYHPDINNDMIVKNLFKEINNAKDFLTDENVKIYKDILRYTA